MEPALSENPSPRPRTQLRRIPRKARHCRAELDAVLDAGLVAHVGLTEPAGPFVLPCGYVRDGDRLLLHGSSASRLMRSLASGAGVCVTVTLLDGLVVARSAFESSMRYRSAMVFGPGSPLPDEEVVEAMRLFTERLMPGRWAQLRPPTTQELKATLVVTVPLDEWSVKISDGWPDDGATDHRDGLWAGVVPLAERYGEPVDSPDLEPGTPVPDYIRRWARPAGSDGSSS